MGNDADLTHLERLEASLAQQRAQELDQLTKTVRQLAQASRGNSLALLELLRMLESLHREICEGLFQEALPNNRQALHNLLRDIEAKGGWPYIYRMRLQELMGNLIQDDFSPDE